MYAIATTRIMMNAIVYIQYPKWIQQHLFTDLFCKDFFSLLSILQLNHN